MAVWRFARYTLGVALAGLFLAGCGGGQSGPRALPQGVTAQGGAHRVPGSAGDLVYAITAKGIVVLSYPSWGIVAKIPGYRTWYSVCSDPNTGNVFAINAATAEGEIDEYAHGGTTPIATFTPPSGYSAFQACAVDPTTGNLAAVVLVSPSHHSAVLVYRGATGIPTPYFDSKLGFNYPAYDGAGNLYVSAIDRARAPRIGEIRAGHKQFTILKLAGNTFPQKLQWDGTYLVFQVANGQRLGTTVNQLTISGKNATIVNSIALTHCNNEYFWIYDGSLISFYYPPKVHDKQAVAAWAYPAGGKPTSRFYGLAKGNVVYDLTVSVAPTGSANP